MKLFRMSKYLGVDYGKQKRRDRFCGLKGPPPTERRTRNLRDGSIEEEILRCGAEKSWISKERWQGGGGGGG